MCDPPRQVCLSFCSAPVCLGIFDLLYRVCVARTARTRSHSHSSQFAPCFVLAGRLCFGLSHFSSCFDHKVVVINCRRLPIFCFCDVSARTLSTCPPLLSSRALRLHFTFTCAHTYTNLLTQPVLHSAALRSSRFVL